MPVDENSRVEFNVHRKNRDKVVSGTFKGLKGEIVFNPEALNNSFFNVSIADSTVHSGNEQRDHDLKDRAFFNAREYPYITLLSTRIKKSNTDGFYLLNGDLNIKGISKPVVIAFKATKDMDDKGYVFTGLLRINRFDFDLGSGDNAFEKEVIISLTVFAKSE